MPPSNEARWSDDESTTPRLKVWKPDETTQREIDRIAGVATPKTVSVPLAQMTRLLLDAAESNRTWLQDFADDVVRIDSDLFEVLMAYQALNRPAA